MPLFPKACLCRENYLAQSCKQVGFWLLAHTLNERVALCYSGNVIVMPRSKASNCSGNQSRPSHSSNDTSGKSLKLTRIHQWASAAALADLLYASFPGSLSILHGFACYRETFAFHVVNTVTHPPAMQRPVNPIGYEVTCHLAILPSPLWVKADPASSKIKKRKEKKRMTNSIIFLTLNNPI